MCNYIFFRKDRKTCSMVMLAYRRTTICWFRLRCWIAEGYTMRRVQMSRDYKWQYIYICEECISGSMRYITSSYMATAFGSRPPWSSLHGPGEDSTASLNVRVLRPKIEWFRLRCSLHHKSCVETKYLRVYRVVLYHLTPSLAGIKLFAGYQPYLAVGKYARWAYD